MASNLRTDSSDYRTELLSPAPAGENVTMASEQSWRLNMDKFHLPDRRLDSSYSSLGYFLKALSKQFQSRLCF